MNVPKTLKLLAKELGFQNGEICNLVDVVRLREKFESCVKNAEETFRLPRCEKPSGFNNRVVQIRQLFIICLDLEATQDFKSLVDLTEDFASFYTRTGDFVSQEVSEMLDIIRVKFDTTARRLIKSRQDLSTLEDYLYEIRDSNLNLFLSKESFEAITDLILRLIEAKISGMRSIKEILDFMGSRSDTDEDVDKLIIGGIELRIPFIEQRAGIGEIVEIISKLQKLDPNMAFGLREYLHSFISRHDSYLDLVQYHGYLDSGVDRDKIEERLAELNADTSNLSDEQFFHRLSITPLGCRARELLEQENTPA